MKKLSSDGYKLLLRLPNGMREVIQDAAAANGRTMTGEIVARLESSFASEPQKPAMRSLSLDVVDQRLEEVERLLGSLSVPDFVAAVRLNDVEARLATLRFANELNSIRRRAKRLNSDSRS
jgi:hypothetical protein